MDELALWCEWCGEAHAQEALCVSRPRWSRRGFLSLLGIGTAGLLLPKLPLIVVPDVAVPTAMGTVPNMGQLVALAWEKAVGQRPMDDMFNSQWLGNRLFDA